MAYDIDVSPTKLREPWWEADEKGLHTAVFNTIKTIEENQRYRERQFLAHARLYGNMEVVGLTGSKYARAQSSTSGRLTLNLGKSITHTLRSKTGKNKVRATILTDDGNWSMQRKAKLLSQFVGGLFYGAKLYRLGPRAIVDACVLGQGGWKVFEMDGEVRVERAFIGEIFVDDEESIEGEPRQLHQKKVIAREVLLRHYCYNGKKLVRPDLARKILDCPSSQTESVSHRRISSMVDVSESWHLPSSKGAGDGRHALCIANAELVDEPWEKDYFPFCWLRWSEPLRGFYGESLFAEIVGLQVEVNKLLARIQKFVQGIAPHVAVQRGSNINNAHISNETWSIIEFDNLPPQPLIFAGLPPELVNLLEFYVQKAYEITGVSQLSAQSQKPAGLNSGVALQNYNDIESERFHEFGSAYEQLFIDTADMMIDVARDIYARDGSFAVKSQASRYGAQFIDTIPWSEIDLKRDQYVMQVFPTSFLPSTPSGRLETIEHFLEVFPEMRPYALPLLDFPDLRAATTLVTSNTESITRGIELMADEGIPFTPDPIGNLELSRSTVAAAYFKFKDQDLPEDRLELFRRHVNECTLMIEASKAVPAAPEAPAMDPASAPPPEGPAPAPQGAPPPADLIAA